MDIRTSDGNVVKVQANEQDVAKALLNADMTAGMYKVSHGLFRWYALLSGVKNFHITYASC